jgi:nucleotide-binding universal stress UspA family protein
VHGETHVTDAASGAAYLGGVAVRLHGLVPDVEIHLHSRPVDDVAAAINAHAAEFGVDLIAMCKHGRSGLKQALLGGIAQRILKGGGTAVLLRSKPQDEPPEYRLRKILAPLDPAHDSRAALDISSSLAMAFHAELHLMTAVPAVAAAREAPLPLSLSPRAEAAEMEMQIEDTERLLAQREAQLRGLGVAATHEVCRGEPARAVLESASRLPADLVIMTTHARTGVEGWYRASTGFRVISRCPQPLLLLREF